MVGIQAANPTKLGDLDGDGQLTVYDLTRLRAHIRGTTPLAANLVPFADVTVDGFINEDDSVSLINTITGASSSKTLPLASIRETSPFSGEGNVALTREVAVRFTMPLALDAALTTWDANTQTPGTLYAEGGGRKLLTRVALSGDHTKATLFFLEPVPASTRITVTFNDSGLKDLLDRQIDPDGDGAANGAVTFTYDTSPITPVPGTGIIGHVYASEKATNGGNTPLEGALVRVVGSETLFTHTAADGSFSLNPCPAGRFFVEVDGRTCSVSSFPNGAYYPYINKAWEALPGKADNLAAGTGVIYLPLVPAGTLKPVSATAETTVTFAPSAIAANPALAGVEIYVPPNSLFADDGTRGGKVGLAPVASDRLPEPLPPGLHHALDISIQTDGATNFDQPVPVKFPNLPDPVTGIKLKPGDKSALWSFNHDKGAWEIVGPMTVTDDGNFVVTDIGVGVRQPGWHGTNPGVSGQDGPVMRQPPNNQGPNDEPEEPVETPQEPGPGDTGPPKPDDKKDDAPPEPPEPDDNVKVRIEVVDLGEGINARGARNLGGNLYEVFPNVFVTLRANATPSGGTYRWKAASDADVKNGNESSFKTSFGVNSTWFATSVVKRNITVEYTSPAFLKASASATLAIVPVSGSQWYYSFPDAAQRFAGNDELIVRALEDGFEAKAVGFLNLLRSSVVYGASGAPLRDQPVPRITSTLRPHARTYLMYRSTEISKQASSSAAVNYAKGIPDYNGANKPEADTFSHPFRMSWIHYNHDFSINSSETKRAASDLKSAFGIVKDNVAPDVSNHNRGTAIDFTFNWSGNLELILPDGSLRIIPGPGSSFYSSTLESIGSMYFGMIHHPGTDYVHWSTNGR